MYCNNCGTKLESDICNNCGAINATVNHENKKNINYPQYDETEGNFVFTKISSIILIVISTCGILITSLVGIVSIYYIFKWYNDLSNDLLRVITFIFLLVVLAAVAAIVFIVLFALISNLIIAIGLLSSSSTSYERFYYRRKSIIFTIFMYYVLSIIGNFTVIYILIFPDAMPTLETKTPLYIALGIFTFLFLIALILTKDLRKVMQYMKKKKKLKK